jgi:3-oxoacyl-[acyl-carrier-protein] synthase I
MRRVVITGYGIVSCLGDTKQKVLESLRQGHSGIRFKELYRSMGLRSHVAGIIDIDLQDKIHRKALRFMGDGAAYAYLSMEQAIKDSALEQDMISGFRTGLIAGSGGASSASLVQTVDLLRSKGIRRVGPFMVPRIMCSTVSGQCLSDQRGQLFNFFRMRYERQLYRQCRGADSTWKAGYCFCRRRGGGALVIKLLF